MVSRGCDCSRSLPLGSGNRLWTPGVGSAKRCSESDHHSRAFARLGPASHALDPGRFAHHTRKAGEVAIGLAQVAQVAGDRGLKSPAGRTAAGVREKRDADSLENRQIRGPAAPAQVRPGRYCPGRYMVAATTQAPRRQSATIRDPRTRMRGSRQNFRGGKFAVARCPPQRSDLVRRRHRRDRIHPK